MDDIQTRLQETSQNCLKAYVEWETQKQDPKAQEGLSSAIHELRKVSSRLEIELAISERDQMTSQPLPIPHHKSTQKSKKKSIQISDNEGGPARKPSGPVVESKGPKRRRSPSAPRKASGGDASSE